MAMGRSLPTAVTVTPPKFSARLGDPPVPLMVEDWCDAIIHPSHDVQADPQTLMWQDKTLAQNQGRAQICDVWIFPELLILWLLFIEFSGFKSSQKLEKIWWEGSRKKVLYIYSANVDPQWFLETQVIPITGQVCCQENKMLRNKMLRMHLGIQESKWNRRNLVLDAFTKEWCDP